MMKYVPGLCLSILLAASLLTPIAGCIKPGKLPPQQPSANQTIPSGPAAPTAPNPPNPPPPTPPNPPPPTPPNPPDNQSGIGVLQANPPIAPSPSSLPAPMATANFSGKWLCGEWGTLNITQIGDVITGTYTYDSGKLKGKVSGDKLSGNWSEAPSYSAPKDAGDVEFTMSADGKSFTGRWRYGSSGDWSTWNGQRDRSNELPPGSN